MCVVVDKVDSDLGACTDPKIRPGAWAHDFSAYGSIQIEKISRAEVEKELSGLGVDPEAIDGILGAISLNSLQDLESESGPIPPLFGSPYLYNQTHQLKPPDWLRLTRE